VAEDSEAEDSEAEDGSGGGTGAREAFRSGGEAVAATETLTMMPKNRFFSFFFDSICYLSSCFA
jgi:hypothetical protein